MNESDSILISVKKVLGVDVDSSDFDTDILLHLNSVLAVLQQLGVGPVDGFFVSGIEQTWNDFLGDNSAYINMVKSYVTAKVRVLFDPPVSSAVMESLNRICSEFEWRINVAAENKQLEDEKAAAEASGDEEPVSEVTNQ